VTRPVKGATLIGNGPDVLTRVTMVGNDLALDSGVGTCGKDGQRAGRRWPAERCALTALRSWYHRVRFVINAETQRRGERREI